MSVRGLAAAVAHLCTCELGSSLGRETEMYNAKQLTHRSDKVEEVTPYMI